MSDHRLAGIALLAGVAGTLVTMLLHPSGHDLLRAGNFASAARLIVVAHSLAIACMVISFLGSIALTRHLDAAGRLAFSALVIYSVAMFAGLIAATASGLIAPGLAENILEAEGAEKETWQALFHYNGHVNQAFAGILVVTSSIAIGVWSVAMLQTARFPRALGWYGVLAGVTAILAIAGGHLRLDVHGFGLVVLAQGIWLASAGVLLMRAPAR
jgi:hypothetical protein